MRVKGGEEERREGEMGRAVRQERGWTLDRMLGASMEGVGGELLGVARQAGSKHAIPLIYRPGVE